MRIVPKLVLAYLVLLLLPFSFFAVTYYRQLHGNLLDEYRSTNSGFIEQAVSNFELELSKVESIYALYQNDNQLTQYLDHRYLFDWQMVYNYLQSISPVFSFVYGSYPNVESVRIYKDDMKVLQIEPEIVNADRYNGPVPIEKIRSLRFSHGLWSHSLPAGGELPTLYYSAKIFNGLFTRELGFMQITVRPGVFAYIQRFLSGHPVDHILLYDPATNRAFGQTIPGWSTSALVDYAKRTPQRGVRSSFARANRYLIDTERIPRLDLVLIEVAKVGPLLGLHPRVVVLILVGVLLLIVLTLVYFLIASSIARRLVQFNRHLKGIEDPGGATYPAQASGDEIGFLINSYNAMVSRLSDVVGDMHRSELLKKEAEIKMLQAQIRPHFLYNTLETMRMMALVNGDGEVAEIASTLGRLLRYSLIKNSETVSLRDEIQNVQDYMEIHKFRMGERLRVTFEIPNDMVNVHFPRLVLQPVVENSILHGIGKLRRTGEIVVSVCEDGNELMIRVKDNGAGIPADRLQSIREDLSRDGIAEHEVAIGIGLAYVNRRMQAHFGARSSVRIESCPGTGTTVELTFPKREVERIDAKAADRRR